MRCIMIRKIYGESSCVKPRHDKHRTHLLGFKLRCSFLSSQPVTACRPPCCKQSPHKDVIGNGFFFTTIDLAPLFFFSFCLSLSLFLWTFGDVHAAKIKIFRDVAWLKLLVGETGRAGARGEWGSGGGCSARQWTVHVFTPSFLSFLFPLFLLFIL